MENSNKDLDALSQEDKIFIEKGGVLVRPFMDDKIECITKHAPYWHFHVGCQFENITERNKRLNHYINNFADYKLYEENDQPNPNPLMEGKEEEVKKNNEMYVELSSTGYNIMDLDKESLSIIFEALHSSGKIKPGKIINLENKICFELTKE